MLRRGSFFGLLLFITSAFASEKTIKPHEPVHYEFVHELQTNWTAAGQHKTLLWWNGEGEDPNKTTYQERGTFTSNTVVIVTVRGKTAHIQLDTAYLGTVHRAYTLETRRVYGPETFFPERFERPWTNNMSITNNIGGSIWETNLFKTNLFLITNTGRLFFPR